MAVGHATADATLAWNCNSNFRRSSSQPILPVLIRVKKHLNRTHDSEADKAEDQLEKHVPRLMQLVCEDLHNRHIEESARRQCLP